MTDDKQKQIEDTGGGCSVCGTEPAKNVEGTYWLCADCLRERIEHNDEYDLDYETIFDLYAPWV